MDFKDKYGQWAVITGGTSGIGEQLAIQTAQRGVDIVLVARRENLLKDKAKAITDEYGVEVKTIQADLSKSDDIDKVVEGTKDLEVGLFIPCAGLENHGTATDIELQKELALIQLNITSTYTLTRHFLRKMVERKKGGVMLVSSTIGHVPNPYFANYSASKAYVLNLGASLNWEMKKKGVDVMVLSPGVTSTPMVSNMKDADMSKFPMKPMTPYDVAKEAVEGLGKKTVVIPGLKNKMMVFVSRRVMGLNRCISIGGKMMENIFKI